MKLLCFDISTNTGFAILDGETIVRTGNITISKGKVADYGPFPFCFADATAEVGQQIADLVAQEQPEVVVVEETNLGKANRYSQKTLEFLHCQVLNRLPRDQRVVYISTADWRKKLGISLSKEQRNTNKRVGKANRSATTAAGKRQARDAAGVTGKVTVKHLTVDWANRTFGLNLLLKDNDIADALALGTAYQRGVKICDGTTRRR